MSELRSQRDATRLVAERAPELFAAIDADEAAGRLDLWGSCRNRDDNVGALIVEPRILEALHRRAGLALDGEVAHAGITHTYGYLLSTLETPYGHKRRRWVEGELERGFALPDGTLGPAPRTGTLLGNVTYILAQVTHTPSQIPAALRDDPSVPAELRELHVASLVIDRVVDAIDVGEPDPVLLVTDVVRFPHGPVSRALAVYSVRESRSSALRLATTFPVDADYAAGMLRATVEPGPVRPRFNTVSPRIEAALAPRWHGRMRVPARTLPELTIPSREPRTR